MDERVSPDEERLRAVFRALGAERVEYAVFGAVALGLHGLARATADLDLFIKAEPENVERLKRALRSVFADPSIDEISAADLCGDFPAGRYPPPDGFGFDLLTRLGTAFRYEDLDIEEHDDEGAPVRVVTPRTLQRIKQDTVRPSDRFDTQLLAERFGFGGDADAGHPLSFDRRDVQAMAGQQQPGESPTRGPHAGCLSQPGEKHPAPDRRPALPVAA